VLGDEFIPLGYKKSIFHSEHIILGKPSVIGYTKEFRLTWLATQLNTFIVASNFGDEDITQSIIEQHRVISILISNNVEDGAIEYCKKLKSGKKWAGFSIPVVFNSETNETYQFEKTPIWGRIYYPHFRKLINSLK